MEENTSENEPAETPTEGAGDAGAAAPDAPATAETAEPAATAPPTEVRLRDRVWSFRSILAVGIASLLLGGAGGAGIVAATEGHGDHERFARFGFGPDGGMRFHRPGGGYGFNGGGPGDPYPPVTPQQNGQTGPTAPAPPSASGG